MTVPEERMKPLWILETTMTIYLSTKRNRPQDLNLQLLTIKWVLKSITQLLKNERPTWCHLLFYFTFYVLNMFRTLIYPSPGACDCIVEIPHRSSCSQFIVCWRFRATGFEWCSFCRLKHNSSRKLLMMNILMSETCWAHKKWNKIASDINLVFHGLARSNKH